MFIVDSYPLAVAFCVVTMLCWGSWANTQKLASRSWRFPLFYWDYVLGVFVFSLVLAFTAGSFGAHGRAFLDDVAQAEWRWLGSAFLGGVVFNVANLLFVAAIDVAGMAVAFPVGVGLALVLGVITNYLSTREGDFNMLAAGVACVVVAIVFDALACRRIAVLRRETLRKGLALAIAAGVVTGFFYKYVAGAMGRLAPGNDGPLLEAAKLSPYTALVLFSAGLFLSSFVLNTLVMRWPFCGERVRGRDYFTTGNVRLHAVGILGGVIWQAGMSFSIIASTRAGAALSYGLGQGATMIGALWGVFVWREFKDAPKGTNLLLGAMFFFYLVGLVILVASRS